MLQNIEDKDGKQKTLQSKTKQRKKKPTKKIITLR